MISGRRLIQQRLGRRAGYPPAIRSENNICVDVCCLCVRGVVCLPGAVYAYSVWGFDGDRFLMSIASRRPERSVAKSKDGSEAILTPNRRLLRAKTRAPSQ